MRLATGLYLLTVAAAPLGAGAQTLHTDRASFAAAAGAVVTDDYQSSGYASTQDDAQMSAVLGVTQYTATGNANVNIVFQPGTATTRVYCAGCNGSFRLGFTGPAFAGGGGTVALGFDYANGQLGTVPAEPYFLFLTFADASTQSIALTVQATLSPTTPSFFGVTSPKAIVSAHLGLADGGATNNGGFVLDDLSVSVSAVPEPGAYALLGAGLLLLAARRRRP